MRSIWFLLFEIKRVLSIIQQSLILRICLFYTFFIQNIYADKKVLKKNGLKIMYRGLNCDRKSQLSEILTELLNPRGMCLCTLLTGAYI